MKFKKISKGHYSFKGIDNWNGKQIQGTIERQPFDVPLKYQWMIKCGENNTIHTAESLKACKKWLTIK